MSHRDMSHVGNMNESCCIYESVIDTSDMEQGAPANTMQQTATHTATRCIFRSAHNQHTATHCSILQHTAAHCITLSHTATHRSTLQYTSQNTATHCTPRNAHNHRTATLITAAHCSTLPHTATHCSALQHTLQHTATHCNTLQHTATHCTPRSTRSQARVTNNEHLLLRVVPPLIDGHHLHSTCKYKANICKKYIYMHISKQTLTHFCHCWLMATTYVHVVHTFDTHTQLDTYTHTHTN